MACVAVNSLIRTLELEFLQPHPRPILQQNELLIPPNKDFIQSLPGKLRSLIEQFDEKRLEGLEAIQHLETRLRDVAFRVEDEIELLAVHLYEEEEEVVHVENTCSSLKLGHILQQAIQDIDAIEKELVKVKVEEYEQRRKAALHEVTIMGDYFHRYRASRSKEIIMEDEFKIITEILIRRNLSEQLEVVSIKGMGGIGKTTLAKQIYEDPSINSYFHKRAWVVASQHHSKRQMLLGLLESMGCGRGDYDIEEPLADLVCRKLKGQRYLIVMDDVWSEEAWDDIKASFPDDNKGSRVLLTTRLAKVANYTCSDDNFSHQMRLMNQSESWDLFCEKADINWRWSFESFKEIGRPIVEKCEGLPLAIVVVAGLFSKFDRLDQWKDIAKALNSATTTPLDEECSRIFSSSYNSLPHNLKACFLYLGVFPGDKEIYTKDLARLWAVEGLIEEFENKSVDAVAKRYIDELVDRNLIFISKQSSGRKVKAFRMHGLVHAFCVREAQKEKLLHVVRENGSNNFPPMSCRWVSIQSAAADLDISTLYSSSSFIKCRSIFCFSEEVTSLHLKIFSLLRVFYFSDARMCKKIVDLVHLRYLPPVVRSFRLLKLFRAWNLQTLLLLNSNVDGKKSLKFPDSRSPKLVLKPSHCTIDFLSKNSHLKTVRISGERRDCNDCIDNLVYLPLLQRLCVDGNVRDYRTTTDLITMNDQIGRLKSLKSLSLRFMNFEWKGINVVSKLPKLEMLRLLFSGIGEKWEIGDEDVFGELLVLEIFSNDLEHWRARSHYSFPKLKTLVLGECSELREIPAGFADIWTLKTIELRKCLPCAVESAKQIQEEQCMLGKDDMVVIEKDTIILGTSPVNIYESD